MSAGAVWQLRENFPPTPTSLACYYLTKTECLYVATKFNDEKRAKLMIRWEELEQKQRASQRANCKPVWLSLSPVSNLPCKSFGGLVGLFQWLCRVPDSTIMLMGGGHDVGCLHRWWVVSVGAACWWCNLKNKIKVERGEYYSSSLQQTETDQIEK